MSSIATKNISAEAYLKDERARKEKVEFFNGKLIPMGGASNNHNRIVTNLVFLFYKSLIEKGYEIYSSDQRVFNPITSSYLYPDIVIIKGKPTFTDNHFDTLNNPFLIIEVTSKSTIDLDHGEKFVAYRSTTSLKEYVLVSQDRPFVETFFREEENKWQLGASQNMEETISFKSVNLELNLKDIYRNVEFKETPQE